MADDKDRENPKERHPKCRSTSSGCGERLVSVLTTSEKQRIVSNRFATGTWTTWTFRARTFAGTRFVNMSLQGCDFSKADLRGADFVGCDLRRANFEEAIFGHNRFENSYLINATGVSERPRGYITAKGGSFWYC